MGGVKILSASAGSGKTYNLAYEYVRNVIDNPLLYRHILAVTFTNKATGEMKQRILSKIHFLAEGRDEQFAANLSKDLSLSRAEVTERARKVRGHILHDYNHFSIFTIDKFFQRIIRSFIKELGIDLNFNLELPVETLLESAADRIIEDISTDERLRNWIIAFVNDKIENNKQWSVRDELVKLGGELFSETYKRREANVGPDFQDELLGIVKSAVARAKKRKNHIVSTAKKLLDMFAVNGLEITDFGYKDAGVAGYISKTAAGEIKEPTKRVFDALDNGLWTAAKSPKRAVIESLIPTLNDLLGQIVTECDDAIKAINTAALLQENYRAFALLGNLSLKVQEVAKEENIVHISEINDMLSRLISGNDAPFIFEKAGNSFSHFMIDEFQDTSAMQWDNFLPLLHNAVSQSEHSPVLLVGDVKQSIYRWRGGDWSILAERAATAFMDTTTITLADNYRSRRTVVEFNNEVVAACVEADNEHLNDVLNSALEAGNLSSALRESLVDAAGKAYVDSRQNPKDDSGGGYVTVTHYPAGDPPPVVRMVEELQERGYTPADIAILVRTNTQAAEIAGMLLSHKNERPDSPFRYDVVTQDALTIGKAPVVNFVIACIMLAVSVDDDISRAVYNHWLERDFGERFSREEIDFFATVRLKPPTEAFECVAIRYNLAAAPSAIAYLQALQEQIIAYSAANIADIPLFLEWWHERGSTKSISMPASADAITIDTIHRSKGLGYNVVIIPYCNWSMTTKPDSIVWSLPVEERHPDGTQEAAEPSGQNLSQSHESRLRPPGQALSQSSESEPQPQSQPRHPFPVKYKKAMERSVFSESYYREYVMSHIDNLNLFYVAVTRAREELHIMMPSSAHSATGKESGKERIGALIEKAISIDGNSAHIGSATGESRVVTNESVGARVAGGITGEVTQVGDDTVIRFGTPDTPHPRTGFERGLRVGFRSGDPARRVRIKLPGQRYFDDGAPDGRLSPRNYGILMHRVFEQAADLDAVRRNALSLSLSGAISQQEFESLMRSLDAAMADERVAEWFSDEWDEVRNESGILTPSGDGYRPDRAMIRGGDVVVVDYKFGEHASPRYRRQMTEYMDLLLEMGYTSATGYIWYVSLGVIDAV